MTLNKTWKECLRMWKWIVKQVDKGDETGVEALKKEWLRTHGYDEYVSGSCFFCDYDRLNGDDNHYCASCPGRLVLESFSCTDTFYNYYNKPKKFYKKLLELDAKRKRVRETK